MPCCSISRPLCGTDRATVPCVSVHVHVRGCSRHGIRCTAIRPDDNCRAKLITEQMLRATICTATALVLSTSAVCASPGDGSAPSALSPASSPGQPAAKGVAVPSASAADSEPAQLEIFDPMRYLGRWYEVASMKKGFAGEGQDDCHCTQVPFYNLHLRVANNNKAMQWPPFHSMLWASDTAHSECQ